VAVPSLPQGAVLRLLQQSEAAAADGFGLRKPDKPSWRIGPKKSKNTSRSKAGREREGSRRRRRRSARRSSPHPPP
jgi:hypothetical protein